MNRWLAALFVACLMQPLLAQFPFMRSLEVRPGQQRPAINCLVQDSLGLLWAGSDMGLYRTDGEFVDVVLRTEGVAVTALHPVGRTVLAALANGVILRCTSTRCDTVLFDPVLSEFPVRAMVPHTDGRICLATYGAGVWIVQPGGVNRITTAEGLPDDHVNGMALLTGDRLVVATDQGLAICSAGKVSEVFDEARGAPDNLVLSVAVAEDGAVVAGTDRRGVFTWKPDQDKVTELDTAWAYGPVSSVACKDKLIWVGTAGHGTVLFDLKTHNTRYREPLIDGQKASTTSLFVDHDGAAWWCDGSERIHRADPAILFVPEHEGVDLRTITAICADPLGRIWFATSEGLFHHAAAFSEELRLTRVPIEVDVRAPIVSLAAAADGTVWAATFGNGVFAVDPSGKVNKYTTSDGLSNDNVLAVRTNGSAVWFATLRGATKWTVRGFEPVASEAGFTFDVWPLSENDALLATDGQGVLHTGTRAEVSAGPRTFYSLVGFGNNTVWAAGPGTGLCKVIPDEPSCIGADRAPFDGDLYALGTALGRIIAFGSTGTVSMDPVTGVWTDLASRFGLQDAQAQLNAITLGSDGSIWYGCDKGLVRIKAEEHHLYPQVAVIITDVLVEGEPTSAQGTINTTHDHNDLLVRFTALHYSDPGAVRFEYRVNDGPIQRTRDREVALSGLLPGTHRLRIRAFAGGQPHGDVWHVLTILVAPPWWKSPWVIGGAVFVLVGVFFLVLRSRERRIRYRDRMEQEKVRFQLEALQSQVDPHFLFNSFNTLVDLIETDAGKAVEHVDELSTFFRNILLVRDKDLITLGEEFGLLHTYFGLEQRRFGKAIELHIEVADDKMNARIVPLTLQLLVENALKHNVGLVDEPLSIGIDLEGDTLVVHNPIRLRTTPPRSTGFGLDSIVKRYASLTTRTIRIDRSDGRFAVYIPLLPATS